MKKIINIKWMHCVSCEVILEKDLKKLEGVKLLMLSHKNWIMEIEYENDSDYKKVIEIIEKNGFKVSENTWNKNDNPVWNIMLNIIVVLVVVILFIFSWLFDLTRFIPDTSTMSYSWAFLVWLIASVSTCLAITWWIIIWFSKYIDSTHSAKWHLSVQLWFQIWRILWFFVLGWLLWLTWKLFSLSFSFSSIFTFFVGILLFYMWLNLLWIIPSITKFWLHMPKSFVSKIEKLWTPKYTPLVWALTFFLPCWFTQTMQLLAISSWSFFAWWLVMMFFALWTFPVLFSVWLWSSYFEWKKFPIFNKIIAAILIFFWISTITNSYNLLSFSLKTNGDIQIEETVDTTSINTQDFINITIWHDWYQLDPIETQLEKGKSYKITILPDENGRWCMSTMVIPKLSSKVNYILKWQAIVYEINSAQEWKYDVVCWSMGMYQGSIIVK